MDFSQVLDLMAEAVASGKLQFPITTVLVSSDGVVMAMRAGGENENDIEILCEYPASSEMAKKPINFLLTDPRGNSIHVVLEKADGKLKWVH